MITERKDVAWILFIGLLAVVLSGILIVVRTTSYANGHKDGWTKAFQVQQDYFENQLVNVDKTHEWVADPVTGETALKVKK